MNLKDILGNHKYLIFGSILLIACGLRYLPEAIIVILIGLLTGVAFLEALKFLMWVGFRQRESGINIENQPMVSIHLAIHNEPSDIVIETIKSVLNQCYSEFELIIVDNNTIDASLWKPIEEFCAPLNNVRFFHLSNWPFYKSGALNFARKVTSQSARYIFIIDADYVLQSKALETAVASIDDSNIALVQFPQAYKCDSTEHSPILEEFNHFFDYYCFKANSCYGALATGTLSLISVASLDHVGGWPVNSITEDAELGSRLQCAGYDIKYVHRVIGKGIAPIHQSDFYQQRKRWIFGNVQTLFQYSLNPFRHFRKWISGVAQLTAWANMLGFPILCLFCSLLFFPWLTNNEIYLISVLSYLSLWIFALSKLGQMVLIHRASPILALHTFLIHFSSLDIGAFHWYPVLFGQKRPFIKTNKLIKDSNYNFNLFYPLMHLGLLLFWVMASDFFLSFSAATFLVLHTVSSLFDCSCRNKEFKNVSTSLKITS